MTRSKYQPGEIEPKWQARWAEDDLYAAHDSDPRPKYYNLVMLPYPSGDLHIGHWYNYTGGDIYGRYMRMRGYNVTQPIGFDAFGLPAENAAIKRNIHRAPGPWTTSPTCAASSPRWARAGTGRARSSPACPITIGGRSGSSCSSTRRARRTARRRRRTGVRTATRRWRTSRWSTAPASAAARPWSGARLTSGCCASPTTPTSC